MSWNSQYFGKNGALSKARKHFWDLQDSGRYRDSWMALVSPYYSAAGFVRAEIHNGKLWGFWIIWAYVYALIALFAALGVYAKRRKDPLTTAEWSTLLPVLTAFPCLSLTREEVEQIIDDQLMRPDAAPHDLALIAAVAMKMRVRDRDFVNARKYAEGIRKILAQHPGIHPGQRARLCSDLVECNLMIGDLLETPTDRESFLEESSGDMELADAAIEASGSEDQKSKFRAMLKRRGITLT